MSIGDQLKELEEIHEANLTWAVIKKLIEVCQDQQYEIEALKDKVGRIRPESMYDNYY